MKYFKNLIFWLCLLLFPAFSVSASHTEDPELSFLRGAKVSCVDITYVPQRLPTLGDNTFFAAASGKKKANRDVSTTIKNKAATRIYKGLSSYKKEVDLSDLKIPYSEKIAGELLDIALDYNLYLFNTLANHSNFSTESEFCACYILGDYIDSFEFNYNATASTLKKQYDALQNKVAKLVSTLKLKEKKAAQSVLAIHDYLALHADYDTAKKPGRKSYTAYGALVDEKAVCSGYSTAAQLLLADCGITSKIAVSEPMDHAWNLILLGGKWYHMDITWDDPYPQKKDYVTYWFFLKTDKEMKQHPISRHYSWDSGGISCTSKKFCRIPLSDNRSLSHEGNFWYYREKKKGTKFYTYKKYDFTFRNSSLLATSSVPFLNYGKNVYFVDKDSRIVSMEVTGKKKKVIKSLPASARITSLKRKKKRLQYQYIWKKQKKTGYANL